MGPASPAPPAADKLQQWHVRMFREFTPSWFTACMGTGSVALAVAKFPWPFPGREYIAMTIWSLNAIVFTLFSVLFLGRFTRYPATIPPLMKHRSEPLFIGAIPMAFFVIANGVVVLWGPRMDTSTSVLVACILWYINLPMTLFSSLIFPFFIISRHENTPESMSAVWLLPIVPSNVAAGSAGVLAQAYVAAGGAEHTLPHAQLVRGIVFIGSMLFSCGMLLTLSITSIYWHRLMVHRFPPAAQLISSFLPVGAIAMCAFSAINLGAAKLLTGIGADPAMVQYESMLQSVGLMLGVILWSYALWWMVVAGASVIDNLRVLPFNLGWWGSVFPTGTMAVLTARLAQAFDLDSLRVVAAIFTVLNFLLWLLVAAMTVKRGYKGQLFYAPCLHTFQQAAAGKDQISVARLRSEQLCVDPGLSGMPDSDMEFIGSPTAPSDAGEDGDMQADDDDGGKGAAAGGAGREGGAAAPRGGRVRAAGNGELSV